MFAKAGNERQLRQTLGLLAWVQIAQRNYVEAQNLCERALDMARDADDDRGVVLALGNLGHVLARQGRIEEAFVHECETLRIARRLMDVSGIAERSSNWRRLPSHAARTRGRSCCWARRAFCGRRPRWRSTSLPRTSWWKRKIVRAEVEPDALLAATARGREMTLDEAVEYALASID